MDGSSAINAKIPPPRRNKYHRRGPWACDECRLRKRKCDGLRPCQPCTSTATSCSYDSRTPTQPATQKLRSLEHKLRLARTTLQQLKLEGIDTGNANLDSVIQACQSDSLVLPDASILDTSARNRQEVDNMMRGCGQLVNLSRNSEAFFGASSGFSFVCRTLELFLKVSDTVPAANIRSAMLKLFDGPLPERSRLIIQRRSLQDLPARATTLRLLDAVFARCPLAAQFLYLADIKQIVDGLYQPMPLHHELHREQNQVLIHSLLALGYLYDVQLHQKEGCRAAVDEALRHFMITRCAIDGTQCSDMTSLQALLCVVIFLVVSSRIVAAHPYIAIAYSSAMRLGLYSHPLDYLSFSQEQRHLRRRTLITVWKLDVYCGLVLGLPSFTDLSGQHKHLVSSETHFESGRENGTRIDNDDALESELSLKHLQLLKITISGMDIVFPQRVMSSMGRDGVSPPPVDTQRLEEVGSQLQHWAESFSTVLLRSRNSPKYEIIKCELEILYYFSQIILYQPFLHYLKRMADGQVLSRSQTRQALACIKISSITISRSEEMMKRGLICPASWMSVYSIFLAVISLVFLVASHNETSKPSEAWKRAQSGIRLLAASRCCDDAATACLGILKKLIAELSHTVDFDIEQIEIGTARLCQHSLMHDDDADEIDGGVWPNEPRASFSGSVGNQLLSRLSFSIPHTPTLWRERSETEASGESGGLDAVAFPCDADDILAQAQGIPLGHGMNYFMHLDDYVSS